MLATPDRRVFLAPERPVERPPAFEVAMVGHCPGRARLDRLGARAMSEIRGLGFRGRLTAALEPGGVADHLPLPFRSAEAFRDVFPEADTTPVPGPVAHAWLPRAVDDFFAAGGETLWVIAVPPEAPLDESLPKAGSFTLDDPDSLLGLAVALLLPDVGLLALPDLERLGLPVGLPLPGGPPEPEPEPRFVRCGDVRTRRAGEVSAAPAEPAAPAIETLAVRLGRIGALLEPSRYRRGDVQCLYTLPLSREPGRLLPRLSAEAAELVRTDGPSGTYLRLQPLFPLLAGADRSLRSPSGLVAGTIAASARERGVWRSVAGRPMPCAALPYPAPDFGTTERLREIGIGVLRGEAGGVVLDDERIAGSSGDGSQALHPGATYAFSCEVVRFLGWLMRRLRRLGEHIVFEVDPEDQRLTLALRQFFERLHAAGALRGGRSEDAFSVRRVPGEEGQAVYEIEIAPSVPIDRIRLTLVNAEAGISIEAAAVAGRA